MVENRTFGDFNAIGPDRVLTMGEVLKVCKDVSKSNAEFVETTLKFVEDNKIAPWGDFPLWVPGSGETAGFHRTSFAKSVKAGLTYRPRPRQWPIRSPGGTPTPKNAAANRARD